MGYFFAFVFLALAVVTGMLYSGTPHGGPTTSCGPVTLFSHVYTIHADCRYVSIGELAAAFLFFFLAVLSVLSARPGRR